MANDPIITQPSGGITALTGDVTASGTGSVAATIADGKVTPSKISTSNTDNFEFPQDVIVDGILKWNAATTKWQAYVVGHDLYIRDTTNNRNLISFSENGVVQVWQFLDFETSAGIRSCPSLMMGGSSINAAAIFQADSTSQGALLPRMTTTQKNAIANPIAGLEVFDTTLQKKCVYTSTGGGQWETITSAP